MRAGLITGFLTEMGSELVYLQYMSHQAPDLNWSGVSGTYIYTRPKHLSLKLVCSSLIEQYSYLYKFSFQVDPFPELRTKNSTQQQI